MTKQKPNHENHKENITAFFEESLSEVMEEKRGIFSNFIQNRLAEVLEGELSKAPVIQNGGDWEEIDSLSKLRSLVGGRFQNLKDKWLAAGFPLKQDKSSKTGVYTLNEKGWIELSSWISNQGFEVRLNPEKKDSIFEIKHVN